VEDKKEENGLDGGVIKDDKAAELEKQLIEEKKQHTELKAEYERMKQEFEAYKQRFPPQPPQPPQPPKFKLNSTVKFIEYSDEEDILLTELKEDTFETLSKKDSEVDTTENKIVLKIAPKI
jgi:hypothetical protein